MDQILLISSTNGNYWKIPGGGIDPGENAKEAAVREALEEAGAIGDVKRCIGRFQDEKRKTSTFVYSMIVTNLVPSIECRKTKWFSVHEAMKELKRSPVELSYLKDKMYTKDEYSKLLAESEVRRH